MSRERITRDDWNRALNVLARGINEIEADIQDFDGLEHWECGEDEPKVGKCRNDLESARKVLRRLLDEKVAR